MVWVQTARCVKPIWKVLIYFMVACCCRYAVLLVISLLTLFFWPSQGVDWENLYIRVCDIFSWIMNKKHSGSVKEKQEDANHDYEMVWDAEGSMHLIKKASAQQGQRSTGQQDTAR
jgi:hypothetical protein